MTQKLCVWSPVSCLHTPSQWFRRRVQAHVLQALTEGAAGILVVLVVFVLEPLQVIRLCSKVWRPLSQKVAKSILSERRPMSQITAEWETLWRTLNVRPWLTLQIRYFMFCLAWKEHKLSRDKGHTFWFLCLILYLVYRMGHKAISDYSEWEQLWVILGKLDIPGKAQGMMEWPKGETQVNTWNHEAHTS